MREDIRDIVAASSTPDEVAGKLAVWARDNADNERIVTSIYEPSVQSDLGGQAFVQLIEMQEDTRLLAVDSRAAFLDMPFEEALDFWRQRGGSREQLDLVLRAYREQAKGASSLFVDAVARRAIAELDLAIDAGSSMSAFAASINDEATNFGLGPVNPAYLETVYRTNIATAYGAGRFRQLSSPAVIAARPYRQYLTVQDSRVRSSHAVLDGLVFDARASDWLRIAPPNGYNCRCSMVSLSREKFLALGGQLTDAVPSDYEAEPGFDGPPTDQI